jgi:hypothetical protein
MEIKVFYSWQSDSLWNRKLILQALEEAAIEVKKRNEHIDIIIDQATSNTVGACHIPNAIFHNISNADIFIGDLSIVGESRDHTRKIPNPNVLIELGYAVSELSWDRIILLFNKESGNFSDLPFDIDKHRCIGFNATSEDDRNNIEQLRTILISQILAIIETDPARPLQTRLNELYTKAYNVDVLAGFWTFRILPNEEGDKKIFHFEIYKNQVEVVKNDFPTETFQIQNFCYDVSTGKIEFSLLNVGAERNHHTGQKIPTSLFMSCEFQLRDSKWMTGTGYMSTGKTMIEMEKGLG